MILFFLRIKYDILYSNISYIFLMIDRTTKNKRHTNIIPHTVYIESQNLKSLFTIAYCILYTIVINNTIVKNIHILKYIYI